MRVPLYKDKNGVANVMQEALNIKPEPVVKNNANVADISKMPVVFNIKGKKIDPALFPQIVDKDGNILLDMSKYYNSQDGKFPRYMKITKDVFNATGNQKGVQILDIIEGTGGKLKIDTDKIPGIKKINWAKIGNYIMKAGSFLLLLI
jgi:hypothetical protein